MENNKFWDTTNTNSIREKVTEFIDNNSSLSKLKGKEHFDLEEALINFIKENKTLIADEVDMEYQREDILSQIETKYGERGKMIVNLLPVEYVDKLVKKWQESFNDNEERWELYWDAATETLENEAIILNGLDFYSEDDFLTYFAYINEWNDNFSRHDTCPERPLGIGEFFYGGDLDNEIIKYYEMLSEQYKKTKE